MKQYKLIIAKWKLIPAIALTISLGWGTSCSDLLDEKLNNQYETEKYFETTARLNMSVQGIYKVLINKKTYGQMWMVAESGTDIYQINGGLGHVARDLGHYNLTPDHSWIEGAWQLYFDGINRANAVIDYGHYATDNDELREQLIAEAYCMRAFLYFDLVRWWGDVPLKLKTSLATDDFNMVREDRDVVYAQIISDLEKGIPNLPWATNKVQGRISKGAAMGLLGKAYLYRGGYALNQEGKMTRPANYKDYYTKAAEIFDTLIKEGKHGLEPSFEGLFKDYYCTTTEYRPFESMFELDFLAISGTSDDLFGVWGTYNSPEISADVPCGRANAFMKTFGHFYDAFDAEDLRREVSIDPNKYGWDKAKQEIVVTKQNYKNSYLWAPGKWRRVWHTMVRVDNNNTDVNYPVLRYADVLLMYAEAENEINGPTVTALERFNQVRRRAYGKDYLAPDVTFDKTYTDSQSFFEAIMEERAKELCFEGHRRQDLIRWNLLEKKIKETAELLQSQKDADVLNTKAPYHSGTTFQTGKGELLPIPARDIRETKGSLTQNPGYGN
ncbi:MAG: RagB/SusD family nutrient uptake outer membrane protein [Dysgonomonas sp.]|nr:RagB/SusD family nutrient uptake outer membrane protein [Dysgonomonas sp.]